MKISGIEKEKSIVSVLLIMIVFFICPTVKAEEIDYSSQVKKINLFIKSQMDKTLPPTQGLSVALVDENGMFWSKGYGYADVKRKVKADARTLYRVGSVTKPVTATAIMMLVEKGKINLDDPITKYIPQFKINNQFEQPITVRHLLSHQAGLLRHIYINFDYQLEVKNPPSYEMVLDYLKKKKLLFCPGEKYKYSNVGYALLGKVIENVSGISYKEFIKQEIFTPLEMDNSYVGLNQENSKLLAKGYESVLNDRAKENKAIRDKSAGSIISTAEDLSKYLQFILNSRADEAGSYLLNKDTVQQMFKKQCFMPKLENSRFGLGWVLNSKLNIICHTGSLGGVYGGGGYHSVIIIVPDKNLGIVLLSNTSSFSKFSDKITMGILKRLRADDK